MSEVVRQISYELPAVALRAYAQLDETLRADVRQRARSPILRWLDEANPRPANLSATIDAVIDLAVAINEFDRGQPEAALALLAPHERYLVGVRRAEELKRDAHAKAIATRREAATAMVRQAQRCLDAGDRDEAELRLAGIELHVLESRRARRRGAPPRRAAQRARAQEKGGARRQARGRRRALPGPDRGRGDPPARAKRIGPRGSSASEMFKSRSSACSGSMRSRAAGSSAMVIQSVSFSDGELTPGARLRGSRRTPAT